MSIIVLFYSEKNIVTEIHEVWIKTVFRLTISSDYNDSIFNSFQNIIFSKKSHLNALGSKFDLDVKYVKVNIGPLFEQTW